MSAGLQFVWQYIDVVEDGVLFLSDPMRIADAVWLRTIGRTGLVMWTGWPADCVRALTLMCSV